MVDALRPGYSDQIAFVVVDVSQPEGRMWAQSYGIGVTTLIFFSRYGQVVGSLHGEQSSQQLHAAFRQLVATDARD